MFSPIKPLFVMLIRLRSLARAESNGKLSMDTKSNQFKETPGQYSPFKMADRRGEKR